jgi:hypothetical protein
MPVVITGSQRERVEQARLYATRAAAMAQKTRNLIALEAEQACLRWVESSRRLEKAEKAAEQAFKLYREVRQAFDPRRDRITVKRLVETGFIQTQLAAQRNEARYQVLLALIAVERVTAAGVCVPLDGAPPYPDDPEGDRPEEPKPDKPAVPGSAGAPPPGRAVTEPEPLSARR